ncbi:protein FAM110C [Thalassophryne amazonica]|uniref:protein FAM110C n=1 Tax=Thalassophryne amazonica TaxID=390379 RepID=UPI0014718433|nr:protein FAM110C [Thalassophryne amazonica]
METASGASKFLEKGPEYLRKQMELESETKGSLSAVERLAASKPKYVKSQQVVNSVQEPVISLGSASVSSTGSSKENSCRPVTPNTSAEASTMTQSPENGQINGSSSKKRPDSLLLYRQKCELLKRSTNYRKRNTKRRLPVSSVHKDNPLSEVTEKECVPDGDEEKITALEEKECSANEVTSQSEKSPLQMKPQSGEADQLGAEESPSPTKVAGVAAKKPDHPTVTEFQRKTGRGVSRSHSDISSRYSKHFADFDAFFKYCGLDGEVIESLGRENFSARSDELAMKIRSVSISTSDGGFSHNSHDSAGLLEEELHENIHQGTSVIERNARIIKWLYSCKNAKETGKKLRDLN